MALLPDKGLSVALTPNTLLEVFVDPVTKKIDTISF